MDHQHETKKASNVGICPLYIQTDYIFISQVDAPTGFVGEIMVRNTAYTCCAKPMPILQPLLLNEYDPISTPDYVQRWIENDRERLANPGTMAEKLYR